MTDDRPAQPGPPGGPPNPPGGRPVEERVAVVETRLDDLPTKGDLAEGLAKSERRMGKRVIKLHTVLVQQVPTYIRITGLVVSTLLGIFFLVTEWRDEQRQKVVEGVQAKLVDVQQVQKAQGETLDKLQQTQARQGEALKAQGETLKAHGEALDRLQQTQARQGETLQAHGEALDRLQRQVGLLVEHLLGGRGAEPGVRGQEPGQQEPQGGGPPPESAPKKLGPPPGRGGVVGAE